MSISVFPMQDALEVLRERIPEKPEVFLVLGSGLSGLAEGVSQGVLRFPGRIIQ